jgi:hypothetical protein
MDRVPVNQGARWPFCKKSPALSNITTIPSTSQNPYVKVLFLYV